MQNRFYNSKFKGSQFIKELRGSNGASSFVWLEVLGFRAVVVHAVLLAAMVLFIGVVGLTGCKKESTSTTDKPDSDKTPISFLVSADTNGWIVPCGCSTKQSGGLLRRGTMVSQMKARQPTIVLDVGGAAAGKSDYHRTKLEAILKGEIAMGVAAHNIGASEAAFGAEVIREIASQLSAPLLSSNVCDADGKLLVEPVKIVEANGLSIAVFGVLDPSLRSGNLQIKEPRQSVLDLLDQLDEPVDGKIVLAYLPREDLFELAKQLPEVDAVIGGPTGQTVAPTQIGATLVASSTNKGKFIVQMEFDPSAGKKWSANIAEVDDTFADETQQVANLDEYHNVLAQADFHATQTGLTNTTMISADPQQRYAGNDSCQKCHVDDCSHYATTKHAIAWKTLALKKSHVDPYCQQCHTTGYGIGSGFASIAKTPQLFNVGCESCHGPSASHADDAKVRTAFVAKDQCMQCHDRENSPAFEYAGYWAKIIHGAKVALNESEVKQ
jgi:2',3'-cyclic-nucleotide 2'-phosphodiesterase (5'-nucleotidase family)